MIWDDQSEKDMQLVIQIHDLETELQSTDYKILKAVEGYDIPDIAEIKARRREIREKISALRDSQESSKVEIRTKV